MEATIETIRKPCAAGAREAGRGSVDMPVLEARPLRVSGAMIGVGSDLPADAVVEAADIAGGRRTTGVSRSPARETTTAAVHGEKVALSDGTQIVFATTCSADDLEALLLTAEARMPPMSLQRYRGR
jgi:predicted homoserine dehydrogenase-like protein